MKRKIGAIFTGFGVNGARYYGFGVRKNVKGIWLPGALCPSLPGGWELEWGYTLSPLQAPSLMVSINRALRPFSKGEDPSFRPL